ncbi:MAG: hypothetical protein KAX65_00880 [Caldilineaceae bacterium]|nr:hypothetical protein [Caldilineaceae bacterium]
MITMLLFGLLALIFVSAAPAPLESLGWWAWSGEKPPNPEQLEAVAEAEGIAESEKDFFFSSTCRASVLSRGHRSLKSRTLSSMPLRRGWSTAR